MKLLNAAELECVSGGRMNPTLRNMVLFTIGAAALGEFLIGDPRGIVLFGMTGLLVSAVFTAINNEEFLEFWYHNVIEPQVF